jgi:hypothetical protein
MRLALLLAAFMFKLLRRLRPFLLPLRPVDVLLPLLSTSSLSLPLLLRGEAGGELPGDAGAADWAARLWAVSSRLLPTLPWLMLSCFFCDARWQDTDVSDPESTSSVGASGGGDLTALPAPASSLVRGTGARLSFWCRACPTNMLLQPRDQTTTTTTTSTAARSKEEGKNR